VTDVAVDDRRVLLSPRHAAFVAAVLSKVRQFEPTKRAGVVIDNGLNAFVSSRFCRVMTSGTYALLRRCIR